MDTSRNKHRGIVSLVAALLIALLAQGFLATGAYAYPNGKRPPNVGPGSAQSWARTLANGHASKHLRDPEAQGTTVGEFPRLIQETLTSPDDAVYLRATPRQDSIGVTAYYTRQVRNAAGNQVRLLVIINVDGGGRPVVTRNASTAYFFNGSFEERIQAQLRRDYQRLEVVPANERGNAPITAFENIVLACGGSTAAVQKRSADQQPGCTAKEFNQDEIDRNKNILARAGCLTVDGEKLDNGTGVTLKACTSGSKSQAWFLSQGRIAIKNDGIQKCLNPQGDAKDNNTPIILYDCSWNPNQAWEYRDDGTFLNTASGKCLDIPKWDEKLIIWDCKNDDEIDNLTQKFDVPSQAVKNEDGQCLETVGGKNDNGTTVRAAACNGSNAQRWSHITGPDETVKMEVLGKCLNIQGEGKGDGTPVILYDCTGGGWNELWKTPIWPQIENPETGKCLQVDDTKATIQTCNARPEQKWRL
ncbi:RICIN domain-containing protein [Streptomyces nigrescens]|uniref:Ricin-type beta-trefoil lectin domain protein n=1 Tax=Streptomyces nigrescens TaxID=1920 RepID=A0ABY7J0E0_STRNI|nr:RICIN domain-containing protein [Streptomyces nigrescens]WAU03777.1 ricin-type beta-trefoil lectin domain protein [Streptomyces nigrescens]